jgi:ABC-type nickel/cobalt efflux system permease component RcnA
MTADVFSALGAGVVLGFRHAFEPDHMAAVTTLAGRHSRVRDAWWLSVNWTIGHTATITLAALLVIALGLRLPERLWPAGELAVSLLLVYLGASVIVRYALGRWHLHAHTHDGVRHVHLHSHRHGAAHDHAHPRADARWALGFGLMHGLAGSGAVLALLVATATTRTAQWVCLASFGCGTMLGMLVVSSSLWGLVRVASVRGTTWVAWLRLASAAASIVVGGMIATGVVTGR